ncbi:hypothetical protein EJ08DRAFT_681807 [Tothia fuscella]|uniref:Uncharacterized protein n=1 Tax=Tothia fuscella TaxID=1048955 RepID=A0A9P4TVN8_9PEZI|nr:hypothetical protein EJ08DRAFT_681807 [Tothia fuscella]
MHLSIAFYVVVSASFQIATTATPHRFQKPINIPIYHQEFPSHRYSRLQKVPGDSPAYYTGDPSTDVLKIENLDLMPNPPHGEDDFTILLEGFLKADVGDHPTLKLSSFLNQTVGPSDVADLCGPGGWKPLEVRQNGTISCPPKEGRVEISWTKWLTRYWMKTGYYRTRVEMYTTNGTKMTDFEATLWLKGDNGLHG